MGLDGGSPDGEDDAEEAWPLDGGVKELGRSPWLAVRSKVFDDELVVVTCWLEGCR